ncbi:MAG: nicotinamide-nucleotide adenylyltransferase [Thermoplasmatales archaeon]|nr:MAG: nicotinamide-nucleotide adenylyltransferase [Thermoplasmatales archaeon]
MKALFIGRFQPFHNGHLKVIQKISKEYDEIIIGIGSSQYSDTIDNPFTAKQREEMINQALKKVGVKNYKIILIPDIHNPTKWVDHVLKIYKDFDVVISNSDLTYHLFTDKGFKVIQTPFYDKDIYSGKEIRKRIRNNQQWDNLVPDEVLKIIKKIRNL